MKILNVKNIIWTAGILLEVFCVCAAVERRITVAVVGFVFGDCLAQRFGRVTEFFEAVDDFLTQSEAGFKNSFHVIFGFGV